MPLGSIAGRSVVMQCACGGWVKALPSLLYIVGPAPQHPK